MAMEIVIFVSKEDGQENHNALWYLTASVAESTNRDVVKLSRELITFEDNDTTSSKIAQLYGKGSIIYVGYDSRIQPSDVKKMQNFLEALTNYGIGYATLHLGKEVVLDEETGSFIRNADGSLLMRDNPLKIAILHRPIFPENVNLPLGTIPAIKTAA